MLQTMNIDHTENCPICLGDYKYLCELDCYLHRNDDVKHFMCQHCVKTLFKSNRWYHQVKCPFCRHTIHRDVILNNSIEIAEINTENEMKQQNNYTSTVDDIEALYYQGLNEFRASNSSTQNISVNDHDRIIITFVLGIIACGLFYFHWIWIGCIFVVLACVSLPTNNIQLNNEMQWNQSDETFNSFTCWIKHLIPLPFQQTRPLYHTRYRGRNKRRVKRKNRKSKGNKRHRKHNKRMQNRNYR
eukprot:132366_1